MRLAFLVRSWCLWLWVQATLILAASSRSYLPGVLFWSLSSLFLCRLICAKHTARRRVAPEAWAQQQGWLLTYVPGYRLSWPRIRQYYGAKRGLCAPAKFQVRSSAKIGPTEWPLALVGRLMLCLQQTHFYTDWWASLRAQLGWSLSSQQGNGLKSA